MKVLANPLLFADINLKEIPVDLQSLTTNKAPDT